jgi:hypothetical protein
MGPIPVHLAFPNMFQRQRIQAVLPKDDYALRAKADLKLSLTLTLSLDQASDSLSFCSGTTKANFGITPERNLAYRIPSIDSFE